MKLKKLFAGVLAGAMIVGCVVMPSSAATSTYSASDSVTVDVSGSGTWYEAAFDFDTLFPAIAYTDDIESITLTWGEGQSSWSNYYTLAININVDPWYTQHANVTSPYSMDMDEFATIRDNAITLAASADAAVEVTVDYTYTAYDDTILYEISESDLSATGYTVTLTSTSGRTATLTGDTYCVQDGKYYIAVDVSEIPASETITMSVVFN